jgi:hydroxymethylpyrimidine/phosphomethylpyrimidine kinase
MGVARVLVISGFEPTGKVGLLADLEAVRSAGAEGVGCITATTAQPDAGAVFVEAVSAASLGAQLDAALSSGTFAAVKLGMVAHPELVRVILERLSRLPATPIVIDPVMATSTGTPLLLAGSRRAVYRELSRLRPIFTPNLPELGILTGQPMAEDDAEEMRQAEVVLGFGARAVLVKGGHREGSVHDFLLTAEAQEHTFHGQRVTSKARGKGCRLASALASFLAQGEPLEAAVEQARAQVRAHLLAHGS